MSDKTDMGGPAFPHGNPEQGGHPGEVTLWDWYAAAALQGLLASGEGAAIETQDGYLHIPMRKAAPMLAEEYADLMLAKRTKRTGGNS